MSARALRSAAPLVLVALLAAPLVWRLTSVPPPDPIVESFTGADGKPLPVLLHYKGRTAGADVFRLQFTTSDPLTLASADEIHLLMADNGTPAVLLEAAIALHGTSCRFRTAPGAPLVDTVFLVFRRQASCTGDEVPSGLLDLEVRLDMGRVQAAVWTFEPPVAGRVKLVDAGNTLSVIGRTLKWPPPPTRTRMQLLAYVWQVTPPVLWARLRTIAVLTGLGLVLLMVPWTDGRRTLQIVCAGLGTAFLMSGLALGHAVLFPPLQTPDEPDFALSLAMLKNDTRLASDIEALAKRTHFQRLRHHTERRFRERDIRRPWPEAWSSEIFGSPMAQRSPVAQLWWEAMGTRVASTAVQHLWTLRRANAVLFGVFCGMAVAILALGLSDARPAALSLTLLAVPTLPFFGAYFSDAAVLVSIAVMLAASVAVLVIGSRRDYWIGVPLAIAVVLAFVSGRAAWPLVIATGGVLTARAFVGGMVGRRAWQVLAFWLPVTLAVAAGVWLAQRAGQFELLDRFLRLPLPGGGGVQVATAVTPWIAAGVPIALAAIDWLTSHIKWRVGAALALGRLVAFAIAAWIVSGVLLSLVTDLPESSQPLGRADPIPYAQQVIASMTVPFRLADHDQLLSTFFWSGMGWVDVVAPVLVLDVAIGATVAAIIWSLVQARSDAARALRYLGLIGGMAISLVVYAVGAYGLTYALYGRYLVGWYLLIIVTAWTAPALSPRPWWPWLLTALSVHAYYLQSIPVRYF